MHTTSRWKRNFSVSSFYMSHCLFSLGWTQPTKEFWCWNFSSGASFQVPKSGIQLSVSTKDVNLTCKRLFLFFFCFVLTLHFFWGRSLLRRGTVEQCGILSPRIKKLKNNTSFWCFPSHFFIASKLPNFLSSRDHTTLNFLFPQMQRGGLYPSCFEVFRTRKFWIIPLNSVCCFLFFQWNLLTFLIAYSWKMRWRSGEKIEKKEVEQLWKVMMLPSDWKVSLSYFFQIKK